MSNDGKQINKARNGKIEFLRFVFCLSVLIFHGANAMTDGKHRIFFSGRLGVEFFFLVSGALMAAAAEKLISRNDSLNIGLETEKFLWRKIKSLYPVVLVAHFLTLFVGALYKDIGLRAFVVRIIKSIPSLFLISQTGMDMSRVNGVWYLSAMLIAMAVLFPLLLRYYDYMRKVGSLLIGLMLTGILMINTNNLASPHAAMGGIILKGTVRGLAEIALGIFVYEMSGELKKIPFNTTGRLLVAAIELLLYGIILAYIMFHRGSKYDFLIVLALTAALTISFSGAAWGHDLFNNRFCYFLGKTTLYLYLGHSSANDDISILVGPDANNKVRMVAYVILAIFMTVILWLLTQLVQKLWDRMRKAILSDNLPVSG